MNRTARILAAMPGVASLLLRHGRPPRAVLFGPKTLGDDLLCSTILHEARQRGKPFAMITNRPELFEDNPDPADIIPVNDYHAETLRRLGTKIVQPYYAHEDARNPDRDVFAPHHILTEMCLLAGIEGEISLRPYLHLNAAEKQRGAIAPRQVAVQSTCRSSAIPFSTKEWGPSRFHEVVTALQSDFHFVQLGTSDDPPLPVQSDLRGRTTLREAAAILACSEAFLGLEGFLAHLARAVDCPSVVILGGRAAAETVGYSCNINFYGAVDCAPCGLRNNCPNELKCMTAIPPAEVVAAVRDLARRQLPKPLIAESAFLSHP